jgi:HD-GYP domain-containing protein (c-di-GMP phosphodiesterase class II)
MGPELEEQLRLAEIVAVLSLAIDYGIGAQPLEFGLRSSLLGLGIGEAAGLDMAGLQDVYYLGQLRFLGCTAEAGLAARIFGDELAARAWLAPADTRPAEMLPAMLRHIGAGEPPWRRLQMVANAIALMPGLMESAVAYCEVGELLARKLGLRPSLRAALWQVYERWDGRGMPRRLKGEAIALPVRIVALAQDAEVWFRIGGVEAVRAMARRRAGGAHDPGLVEVFCRSADDLLGRVEVASPLAAVLAAEPGAPALLAAGQVEPALQALGEFADLKAPGRAGHSGGVAGLAAEAARRCGLADPEARTLLAAGYLHDLGRVGVTAAIWGKAGPLTSGEWERVRLYPYYTERVLARPEAFASARRLAAMHAERLDGDGYPRGLDAAQLTLPAKILAAADVYRALVEPRPHRPALTAEAAAAETRREAAAGRLDRDAVEAVLGAAGHLARRALPPRPAGLSEREVEVLRLAARGLSNRQIAEALIVSPKTVGHHVQHIYDKIGVSTRVGATLFALQHGLVQETE